MTSSTAALRASAVAFAVAVGIAACGGSSGGDTGGSAPGAVTSGSAASGGGSGAQASSKAESGAQIFSSAGCSGCHTLAAAHSTGTIGPDLDSLKPAYATVVHQVEHGGGGMPSFKNQLTAAEISAVAHYVAGSTHAHAR